jgi:hypothetical protein
MKTKNSKLKLSKSNNRLSIPAKKSKGMTPEKEIASLKGKNKTESTGVTE